LRYGAIKNMRPDVVIARGELSVDGVAERYLAEIVAPPDYLTDAQLVFENAKGPLVSGPPVGLLSARLSS
jgi:hypothetical protein